MTDRSPGSAKPRVLVIGREGQVARSLGRTALPTLDFINRGRSDGLDLTDARSVEAAVAAVGPDLVVNAAAYTAVDRAESEPDAAFALNRDGPAALAAITATRRLPLIHLSTDYVFDGSKPDPYVEDDEPSPLGVYGWSKAEGEDAVRRATGDHIILRTAWVYSPFGANFVKTMRRLAEERDEVAVVADQVGSPTAAGDIAVAIGAIAEQVLVGGAAVRGTFHLAGAGTASWFDVAGAVFAERAARGLRVPPVFRAITTAEYPTAARRPMNSRLDTTRLRETFGVTLPHWRESLAAVMTALEAEPR
ncbi:MAG: dTDP-4-dehydrorhamnose reductase [Bauldia sp.]|nr:dTDP-4-dehydrorhamnose reductase [Bauldia sp.]